MTDGINQQWTILMCLFFSLEMLWQRATVWLIAQTYLLPYVTNFICWELGDRHEKFSTFCFGSHEPQLTNWSLMTEQTHDFNIGSLIGFQAIPTSQAEDGSSDD